MKNFVSSSKQLLIKTADNCSIILLLPAISNSILSPKEGIFIIPSIITPFTFHILHQPTFYYTVIFSFTHQPPQIYPLQPRRSDTYTLPADPQLPVQIRIPGRHIFSFCLPLPAFLPLPRSSPPANK